MADLISTLEVETVIEQEDLRNLRTQVLVCIHWIGTFSAGPSLAIWEINDDGSLDTGDWLRQHWNTQ